MIFRKMIALKWHGTVLYIVDVGSSRSVQRCGTKPQTQRLSLSDYRDLLIRVYFPEALNFAYYVHADSHEFITFQKLSFSHEVRECNANGKPVLGQSPPGHYPSGQSPVGRRRQRDRFKESIKDQYSCFADWMTCKSTYTPPPPWTKWPPFRRMWNFCILIKISLKLVFHGPIDNNPALVQIMAWRRIGDKPLSEPMLTQFTDAFLRH